MKKPIIIGLIAVLVLGGGTSAYGYSKLDWFKSAKQTYLETEAKNDAALLKVMDSKFTELQSAYQLYSDSSSHSKQQITADVSVGEKSSDMTTALVLGILKQSNITIETSNDPKNQLQMSQIGVSINGAQPANVVAFSDKDKEALGFPTFYNKYFIANHKDNDTIKQNLGFSIPKQQIGPNDFLKAIKTTSSEIQPIYETYAKIYASSLADSQVKKAPGTFTEDGANIKGTEYTITFTKDQYKGLIDKISDQLANDQQLADLIYNKYNNLLTLYKDSGVDVTDVKSKDDIQKAIKDFASSLKNDNDTVSGDVTLKVFVDSQKKILEEAMSTNDNPNLLKYVNFTGEDQSKHFGITLGDKTGSASLAYAVTPQDKTANKGTVTLAFKNTGGSQGDDEINFKVNFITKNDASTKTKDIDFTLTGTSADGPSKVTGTINISDTVDQSGKNHKFDGTITLNGNAPDSSIGDVHVTLKTTGTFDFGGEVKLPDINASNSIDLAKTTTDDLNNAVQQVQQGLGAYIMQNPSLQQILLPFLMGSK